MFGKCICADKVKETLDFSCNGRIHFNGWSSSGALLCNFLKQKDILTVTFKNKKKTKQAKKSLYFRHFCTCGRVHTHTHTQSSDLPELLEWN